MQRLSKRRMYIRRLDNLCVVLAVIVIIKRIISLGKKKKKKASMQNNYKFRGKKEKGEHACIEPGIATT